MTQRRRALSPQKLFLQSFLRHRLAVMGAVVVAAVYCVALLAEILAPTAAGTHNVSYPLAPPSPLGVTFRDEAGQRHFQLHVKGFRQQFDPATLRRTFTVVTDEVIPLGFFVRGDPYRLWGIVPWDRHLIGPLEAGAPFFLLGSDRLGRDLFSRMIYGTRISLTVGLLGVAFSFLFGIILGGLSGTFGGLVDDVIQRLIEILDAIPTIPLWLALAAAIPVGVPPLQVYFMVTVILSLVGWTQLARVVRGRFLSLRDEEFVAAARLDGVPPLAIIRSHLVPNFASHIIAALTLAVPGMILAETSLSFLGVGLRAPVVSWGVLLQDAQNIRTIAQAPWLLAPGAAVFLTVLALNFLGDGLRDAADPQTT